MMRRLFPLLAAALLALQLAGCGAENADEAANGSITVDVPAANTEATPSASPAETNKAPEPSQSEASAEPSPSSATAAEALQSAAKEVVGALRDRDLKRLASWIDADKGVRFSPYAHMDEKNDMLFQADRLPTFKDSNALTWGSYDGSGEAIKLTFRDYFEKFVYDQDFADAPKISVNKLIGSGNTPFNGQEIYPDASYVEFHFPGFDSKLEGHDWESLILVFEPSGDDWRLCAITHAQWTI